MLHRRPESVHSERKQDGALWNHRAKFLFLHSFYIRRNFPIPKTQLQVQSCEMSSDIHIVIAQGDITGYVTFDNYGVIKADGVTVKEKTNRWEDSISFTLPANTKVVVFEGGNGANSPGGIVASFSNGVVTDESWECTDGASVNSAAWPVAVTYGRNSWAPSPWKRVIQPISGSAQWIWTVNSKAVSVHCRKSFEVPASSTITEIKVSSSITEVPESSSITEVPASSIIAEVPASSTNAEVPASSTIAEVPTSSTIAEAPASSTIAEVPASSTIAEVPASSTIAELTTSSSSSEEPASSSTTVAPTSSSTTEKPALSSNTAEPPSSSSTSAVLNVEASSNVGPTDVSHHIAATGTSNSEPSPANISPTASPEYNASPTNFLSSVPLSSRPIATNISPSASSKVKPSPTSVFPSGGHSSQAKNQSVQQANKYEKMIENVDLNEKDALSELIDITSDHIAELSNEGTKNEKREAAAMSGIFERRLVEYAKKRLDLNVSIERKTEDFVIQLRKLNNLRSTDDIIFPAKEDTDISHDDVALKNDFIVIPRDLVPDGSIFVGVLYLTLDHILIDTSESGFENEQLNTKIISAEISPKHKVTLKKNVTFTLNHRNKTTFGSNCVFIQESRNTEIPTFSNAGCSVLFTNGSSTTCTCNHMTSFAVLTKVKNPDGTKPLPRGHSRALSIITYLGISLSLLGEALTVASYVLLIGLKTEQAHLHTNLALSLGLAQISFLIGINLTTSNKATCLLVASLIHYFYLVTFCWMVAEGFHLYLMVVKVFNEESYLKKYYAFSWITPLLIVVLSVVSAAATHHGVYSYISDEICWVSAENKFIWSFLGPVLLVCLVNFVLLFLVVREMTKMGKSKDGPSLQLRKSVKACLLLFPILGTTWVFCVLTMISSSLIFEYMFNIFNSLQGFFIFLFHVVRSTEIRAVFERRRMQWNNSMDLSNNLSSNQKTRTTKSSPASASSIKPIIGNWVDTNDRESPDLFCQTNRLSACSTGNQIVPEIETPT